MAWQWTPYVTVEFAAALILAILAVYYPWRDPSIKASRAGALFLLVSAVWMLFHALEIGSSIAQTKYYLDEAQFVCAIIASTMWLIYIIHYTWYSERLSRSIFVILGIIPLFALLLVVTNQSHGLMWTNAALNTDNPYLPLVVTNGIGAWACIVYAYALFLVGLFMLVQTLIRMRCFHRWEARALIFLLASPLLVTLLDVFGFEHLLHGLGLAPWGATVFGVALVWILPRLWLEDILPVVRETVIEDMADGVIVLDMQRRILDLNQAAQQLTGHTVFEAFGKPVEQIWPDWTEHMNLSDNATEVTKEVTLGKGNRQHAYDVRISPVTSLGGNLVGQVIVLHDITKRKKAEKERMELEKKAQLASHLASVGEMASGIAHEINNPLTGVIGYSQLLMQDDIPEDIKKDIRLIHDGAQRAAGIIKGMLTFARQHKPERNYVDINDLIASTLDLRAYSLRTNSIEVTTYFDPELPVTVADGNQLQQVFLNLIVNAETEMKLAHGRGNLSIKTEAIDDIIKISVKDDGPGIPRKNMAKLFDPFFTTKKVGQGTGLGLSVCHGIIAEHEGRIYAESKLHRGATFIVELPVVTRLEQPELTEPEDEEYQQVTKARILIVDDDPTILDFLNHVLTGEGYEIETVDNADDALEKVKSKRYNLILLDVKMPGMSGIDFYKHLLKIARSFARRVVFITGDVIGVDTQDFLSEVKVPCIAKPFDVEQLKKEITRILAKGA